MKDPIRPDLAARLQMHRDFWSCAPVPRPLVGVTLAGYLAVQMFAASHKSGYLEPEDVSVADFMGDYEGQFAAESQLPGDQIWGASPYTGIPWMEAIIGCPISTSADAMWADPVADPWSQIERVSLGPENRWLQKLIEFTRALDGLSRGRFPVGTTLMRGPADMLAAARGNEDFCLDLYDRPEETRRALLRCAEIRNEVARAQLAVAAPFHGGYPVPMRQVWAPGASLEMQEDASALVSPQLYRQLFQPADDLIASAFDYPLFHVHSGSLHTMEGIVAIRGLRGVEVSVDVGGPPLERIVPGVRLAQERGLPVLLHGTLSPTEVAYLAESLSPVGLYIVSRVRSPEEAREVVEAVKGRGLRTGTNSLT